MLLAFPASDASFTFTIDW